MMNYHCGFNQVVCINLNLGDFNMKIAFYFCAAVFYLTLAASAQTKAQSTGLIFLDTARYLSIPPAAPPLTGPPPAYIDLSKDFPVPGNQGDQASCVAWASSRIQSG